MPTNTPEWIQYKEEIHPYFDLCANKTVLEIAPFFGTHTQIIESHGAKNITLVEFNDHAISILKRTQNKHTIINDDIFNYLQTKREFDVVVCCGLLYHLHSPLYLLELIANMVDPEYLYIETYTAPDLQFNEELDNNFGMRQIKKGYKSVGLSLLLTEEVLLRSIKNLGYTLIQESGHLAKPTNPVKLLIFKRT